MVTQTEKNSIYKIDGAGNPVEKKPGAWKQALWGWHEVNDHWNYNTNDLTIVEVYSNCDEVELFLNGKSLGVKKLDDFEDRIYKWAVPFEKGTLKAQGKRNGEVVETTLITALEPNAIELSVDNTQLRANGYDVAHIVAQLVDKNGNPVKNNDREITFTINGDVKILGVDNGANDNVQDFQSNKLMTSQGRCLLIVQSERKPSDIDLQADSGTLKSNMLTISVKPANNQ